METHFEVVFSPGNVRGTITTTSLTFQTDLSRVSCGGGDIQVEDPRTENPENPPCNAPPDIGASSTRTARSDKIRLPNVTLRVSRSTIELGNVALSSDNSAAYQILVKLRRHVLLSLVQDSIVSLLWSPNMNYPFGMEQGTWRLHCETVSLHECEPG